MRKVKLLFKLEVVFFIAELMFLGMSSSTKNNKNMKFFKNCELASFLGMLVSYGAMLFQLFKKDEKEEELEKK